MYMYSCRNTVNTDFIIHKSGDSIRKYKHYEFNTVQKNPFSFFLSFCSVEISQHWLNTENSP